MGAKENEQRNENTHSERDDWVQVQGEYTCDVQWNTVNTQRYRCFIVVYVNSTVKYQFDSLKDGQIIKLICKPSVKNCVHCSAIANTKIPNSMKKTLKLKNQTTNTPLEAMNIVDLSWVEKKNNTQISTFFLMVTVKLIRFDWIFDLHNTSFSILHSLLQDVLLFSCYEICSYRRIATIFTHHSKNSIIITCFIVLHPFRTTITPIRKLFFISKEKKAKHVISLTNYDGIAKSINNSCNCIFK